MDTQTVAQKWENIKDMRYVVLYRIGHKSSIKIRSFIGYTFSIVRDNDDPDIIYLILDNYTGKKYAKIDWFDPSLIGVYHIIKFEPRLGSFMLRRLLPLPYYHSLGSTGIKINSHVMINEHNYNGFYFINVVRTKYKKAPYVTSIRKKNHRDIVLYKRVDEDTLSLIRVSSSMIFSRYRPLPWSSWLNISI